MSGQQEPLLLLVMSTLFRSHVHKETTGACAGLDVFTSHAAELHLDKPRQQEPLLVWTCLNHMRLSCTWTCLHHRGLCCTWTTVGMSSPQGPELHIYMSGQQEPLLLLDVTTLYRGLRCTWTWTTGACAGLDLSTSHGAELHLDVATLQKPVLHLDVSTSQGPELHPDAPRQHELHLDKRSCTWTCLNKRSLYCSWTCLPGA
jgi:hypothetical protein